MKIIERTLNADTYNWLLSNKIHPLVADALAKRGMEKGEIPMPGLSRLIHWSELKDCEKAAETLLTDIEAGTKMLIVADYDCDGATACATLYRGLKAFGANIHYIVPDRAIHGYGLTPSIVEEAFATHMPDLIITVDNGIASVAGVQAALDLGVRVLVTDHHLPGDDTPPAEAIVNPNQRGCDFPSKALAGCGVAWYLLWAMSEISGHDFDVRSLLPIVALGTIADVVKLDQNNRILVSEGLRMINNGQAQPGIYAIAKVAKKNPKDLTSLDFGFSLGPRVNAAGRLESMDQGINCLLSDDEGEALKLACDLDRINSERRAMQTNILESAEQRIFSVLQGFEKRHSVCVSDPEWHQGIIGIVAGRIKEQLNRPTIVFSQLETGEHKGSGRSIPSLHLRDAIDVVTKRHPELVAKFGGHAMAAGLTLNPGCFEKFSEAFEKVCQELLTEDQLVERVEIDGELKAEHFNLDCALAIREFVWGQGFPEPLYRGTFEVVKQDLLKEAHSKFTLKHVDGSEATAMLFNYAERVPAGTKITVLYKLNAEAFNNQRQFKLMIDRILPNA